MNQSGWITTALLGGFILWLAANDRLQSYTEVLWGEASTKTDVNSAPAKTADKPKSGFSIDDALRWGKNALAIFGGG